MIIFVPILIAGLLLGADYVSQYESILSTSFPQFFFYYELLDSFLGDLYESLIFDSPASPQYTAYETVEFLNSIASLLKWMFFVYVAYLITMVTVYHFWPVAYDPSSISSTQLPTRRFFSSRRRRRHGNNSSPPRQESAPTQLDLVTNSLSTLSIASPDVADNFTNLPLSAPVTTGGWGRFQSAIGAIFNGFSSNPTSSGTLDDDLPSAFDALSLKPNLKSCLKSGPATHAKSVSFGGEGRTICLVRFFERDGPPPHIFDGFFDYAEHITSVPHHRGFRHYLPPTNHGTPMVRYDGTFCEPERHSDIEKELFRVEDGHCRRRKKSERRWCCNKYPFLAAAGRVLKPLPNFT